MVEIIESYEFWEKRAKDLEKSINKKQGELNDLNQGKTTFKSVFSTKTSDE